MGIVTLVNPLHPENAEEPMDVTLLGIVTLVNLLHPRNAQLPIAVTLLGIVTLVNPVQFWNAPSLMEVTGRLSIVAGITKAPLAWGLLPVMVIVLTLDEYNNGDLLTVNRAVRLVTVVSRLETLTW